MSAPDGGNAFPQALAIEKEFIGCEGMSLRDYFAGQALIGLYIADQESRRQVHSEGGQEHEDDGDRTQKLLAALAYQQADMMLAERVK